MWGRILESSSADFWINRWENEKGYICAPLYMYKYTLKGLKNILTKHKVDLSEKSVLDVGCGRGFYTEFYRRKSAYVLSVDVSNVVVERMRKEGKKAALWDFSSEEEFPFGNQKYYLVHCAQTLVHVVDDEKFKTACINLGRRVEKGGYIILGDRFLPDRKINKIHIKYRTVVDYIMEITKNTGIKFLDVIPSFPLGGRILIFRRGI